MSFDTFNRLKYDDCALESRILENSSQFTYNVTNPLYLRDLACHKSRDARRRPNGDDNDQKENKCRATVGKFNADGSISCDVSATQDQCATPDKFALNNRNLRCWSGGPGVSGSEIDVDSVFRNEKDEGSEPRPQQLRTRVFHGVPDKRRGKYRPGIELRLQKGRATSMPRYESEIDATEQQFDVFHPTVEMPSVEHIIPPWTRGGTSSREINRSPAFLKALGYEWNKDKRTWMATSALATPPQT